MLDTLIKLLGRIPNRLATLILEELDEEPDHVIPTMDAMLHIRRLPGLRRVVFREHLSLSPNIVATFARRSAAGSSRFEAVGVE